MAPSPSPSSIRSSRGLLYALSAYGLWGLIPIYFKMLSPAPPLQILAHRVLWAFVMLVIVAGRLGLFRELRAAFRRPRTVALLVAGSVLIALNWLVYIWAVMEGRVLEGSLGYYINPLVNVLLGVLVFKERLERPVVAAIAVAAAGVLWLTLDVGKAPWTSLSLALSFGLYGLVRKLIPVGAVAALTAEAGLLVPLAVGYLAVSRARGTLTFGTGSPGHDVLLVLSGPITAIPLLCFAGAVRRLPLTTLGFVQYLSPTLQFLLAVVLYNEPLTAARGVAFACIWTALAIFAVHTLRRGQEEPITEA